MRASWVDEEQIAKQLPRYLRSDTLSVYKQHVSGSGRENDYQFEVDTIAAAFLKEQQRKIAILQVRQKKHQRVGDYKEEFIKAIKATYPDESTADQIFMRGLIPKYYDIVRRKNKTK